MIDNLTIQTIQYQSLESINIVFIADGYLENEEDVYHAKVNDAITALFNKSPFDLHRDKFNIFSIPTISNESGISTLTHPNNPVTETIKDTFLGSFRNRSGLIRYTGITKKQELEDYLTTVFFNKIYLCVIANSDLYGGSGDFPDGNIMPMTHVMMDNQYNTFGNLFIHEFGHSFGGLADEYGGGCFGGGIDFDEELFDRGNVTNDIVNDRKWDYLDNPQYIAGANYCDTDWYRSSQSSIMRGWFEFGTTDDEEFNQVSKDIIEKRILEEINQNIINFINDKTIKTYNGYKLPIKYKVK